MAVGFGVGVVVGFRVGVVVGFGVGVAVGFGVALGFGVGAGLRTPAGVGVGVGFRATWVLAEVPTPNRYRKNPMKPPDFFFGAGVGFGDGGTARTGSARRMTTPAVLDAFGVVNCTCSGLEEVAGSPGVTVI